MGMFDTVKCEVELPGAVKPDGYYWLQTKDFGCDLDTYTITADGRLVGPYGPLLFHGLLNFYTYRKDSPDPRSDGMWFEYEAKFTDGKLQGIEVVEISRTKFGSHDREVLEQRAVPDALTTHKGES